MSASPPTPSADAPPSLAGWPLPARMVGGLPVVSMLSAFCAYAPLQPPRLTAAHAAHKENQDPPPRTAGVIWRG